MISQMKSFELLPKIAGWFEEQEVDFQSLIGYVGGYVGLIMGFAIAQIPEIIKTTVSFFTSQHDNRKKRKSQSMRRMNTNLNIDRYA